MEQLHLKVVKISADQHSVVAQELEPQRAVRPIEVLKGARGCDRVRRPIQLVERDLPEIGHRLEVLVEQAVPSDGHHQHLQYSREQVRTISGRIVIAIVRGREGPAVSYFTLMALEQSSKDWSKDMFSHLYYFIVLYSTFTQKSLVTVCSAT